jgi:hypothetical protein
MCAVASAAPGVFCTLPGALQGLWRWRKPSRSLTPCPETAGPSSSEPISHAVPRDGRAKQQRTDLSRRAPRRPGQAAANAPPRLLRPAGSCVEPSGKARQSSSSLFCRTWAPRFPCRFVKASKRWRAALPPRAAGGWLVESFTMTGYTGTLHCRVPSSAPRRARRDAPRRGGPRLCALCPDRVEIGRVFVSFCPAPPAFQATAHGPLSGSALLTRSASCSICMPAASRTPMVRNVVAAPWTANQATSSSGESRS